MTKNQFLRKQFLLNFFRKSGCFLSSGNFCCVCGKESINEPVCKSCKELKFKVSEIDDSLCSVCGKRLISEKKICMQCRENVLLSHLDGVYPVLSYRLWNTNLLCRWKLEGERQISYFFSKLLNERLKQLYSKAGHFFIVPVPPRPGKIKENGWYQVQELSEFLEFKYEYDVERIMERQTSVQQKTLDRNERLETIGKSYFVKQGVKKIPEIVCLIDDVMTTGATLESCAEKLKEAGAKKVFAVTLFSVDR